MFRTLILSVTAGGLLLLLPLETLRAQTKTMDAAFRTNSQMVLVPITVTDHSGKTVQGLRAQDFNVFEDQVPQQIMAFTSEDAPCSVGLVLDISGSMRSSLAAAKSVAQSFVKTANQEDEFMLLTVSSQPEAVPGFTTDTAALQDNIAATTSGGMTALIDTLYLGLNRMRKAGQPRRALLVLSDGVDNYSRYSKGELMRVAFEADVQIYSIIVDNGAANAVPATVPFRPMLIRKGGDQSQQAEGPRMLEELSEKTGGLHFHVRTDAEANAAAIQAGQALRNEYVIGYHPPVSGISGKWHRVRVKSTVPKLNVYARNGYYAP